MTEQPPPSAEALQTALDYCKFTRLPHPNLSEERAEVLELAALLDRFADRVCEQRVSAARRSWVREDAKAMRPFEEEASAILDECERSYDCDVPHKIDVIARALRQRVSDETERCGQIAHSWQRADALKLAAGEMTAQEVRTARAAAAGIERAIRAPAERPAPEGPEQPDWLTKQLDDARREVSSWPEGKRRAMKLAIAQDSLRGIGVGQRTQEIDRPVGGPEGRAPDEPLDYIGTEPPPVGYVRLGWACPRDAALCCSGCDETDVTPDMCGSGHPAYRSQKWIAYAGRPLPFPSALASTGEQPDKEEDFGKESV